MELVELHGNFNWALVFCELPYTMLIALEF